MKWNEDLIWDILLFLLIATGTLSMLSSCKTKYVSVPEYHTQYVNKSDTLWRLDSILVRDSASVVYVGDTIKTFKYKYQERYKYIYRNKIDTMVVRDSVPYMVPLNHTEVKEVGKGWYRLSLALLIALIVVSTKLYIEKKQ